MLDSYISYGLRVKGNTISDWARTANVNQTVPCKLRFLVTQRNK